MGYGLLKRDHFKFPCYIEECVKLFAVFLKADTSQLSNTSRG